MGDHEDPHHRGRADAAAGRRAAVQRRRRRAGVARALDGGGYPDGLAGEEIPVAARIVAACDAFNALTTDRSYRKALPSEVAIAEAAGQRRPAPDVVEALVAVIERETPGWQLSIAEPAAELETPRLTNVSGAG